MPNIKIKGPKPKNCYNCRFAEGEPFDEFHFCILLQKDFKMLQTERLKKCPFNKKTKWRKICLKLKKKLKLLTS